MECFLLTTVNAPMEGVQQALVIAGSDPRGTAYGMFELSRAAGVSPWTWWADVIPAKQNNLSVLPATFVSKEPSVKYRGIFLMMKTGVFNPGLQKHLNPKREISAQKPTRNCLNYCFD